MLSLTVARSGPGNATVHKLVTLLKKVDPLQEINSISRDTILVLAVAGALNLLGGLALGRASFGEACALRSFIRFERFLILLKKLSQVPILKPSAYKQDEINK